VDSDRVQLSEREEKAQKYTESLKKRYENTIQINRIARHRSLASDIYKKMVKHKVIMMTHHRDEERLLMVEDHIYGRQEEAAENRTERQRVWKEGHEEERYECRLPSLKRQYKNPFFIIWFDIRTKMGFYFSSQE